MILTTESPTRSLPKPSGEYRECVASGQQPSPATLVANRRTLRDWQADCRKRRLRERSARELADVAKLEDDAKSLPAGSEQRREREGDLMRRRGEALATLRQTAARTASAVASELARERAQILQRIQERKAVLGADARLTAAKQKAESLSLNWTPTAETEYERALDEIDSLERQRQCVGAEQQADTRDRATLAALESRLRQAETALLEPSTMDCDGER